MTAAGEGAPAGSRQEAQQRLDRARAFRDELRELEGSGVLALSPEQHERLDEHYRDLTARLAERFDVDASREARRLSWGMAVASLLGALALGAAVFFAFYRFWGEFPTAVQVLVLVAAPVLGVILTDWVARRERTPWFTKLAALVALATAILDLKLLGGLFNIPPSPNALLVWAAFALALAYGYGLRLLLFLGLVFGLGYLAAVVGSWGAVYWLSFFHRPENLFVGAVLLVAAPLGIPHRVHPEFTPVYWILGLLALFLPMLFLGNWGYVSYLPWAPDTVEIVYQVAGFLLSAAVIAVGIHWGLANVASTGVVFFVVLLYDKFFDWCWDWMPKYLFFLVIALAAVAVMWMLGRMRRMLAGAGT